MEMSEYMTNEEMVHELQLDPGFKMPERCLSRDDPSLVWGSLAVHVSNGSFFLARNMLRGTCKILKGIDSTVDIQDDDLYVQMSEIAAALQRIEPCVTDALAAIAALPESNEKFCNFVRFVVENTEIANAKAFNKFICDTLAPAVADRGDEYERRKLALKYDALPRLDAFAPAASHAKFMASVVLRVTPENIPETLEYDATRLCYIRAKVEGMLDIGTVIEDFLDGKPAAPFPEQELLLKVSNLHLRVHSDTLRLHGVEH
jgi:hypothetical protein